MGRKKGGGKGGASKKGTRGTRGRGAGDQPEDFAAAEGENFGWESAPGTPGAPRAATDAEAGTTQYHLVIDQLEEAVLQAQQKRSDLREVGYRTLVRVLRTDCLAQIVEADLAPAILRCALETMKKRHGREFHLAVKVLLCLSVIVANGAGSASFFPTIYEPVSLRISRWKAAQLKDREDKQRGTAADGRDSADAESSADTELVGDMVTLLGCACFLNSEEQSEIQKCAELLENLFVPPTGAIEEWQKEEDILAGKSRSGSYSAQGGGGGGGGHAYNWEEDYEDEENFNYESSDEGQEDRSDAEESDSDASSSEDTEGATKGDATAGGGSTDMTYAELQAQGANPILAAAIRGWTLLLNLQAAGTSSWLRKPVLRRRLLQIMAFWLSHSDVNVQCAAAKCIGVFYELCGDELEEDAASAIEIGSPAAVTEDQHQPGSDSAASDDEPGVPALPAASVSETAGAGITASNTEAGAVASDTVNWLEVVQHMLASLRKESVHRRKRGDRKVGRRLFSSLAHTLEGYEYNGETSVQLSSVDTLSIDSWSSLLRYEVLCLAIGDGVAAHVQSPGSVIRDLFSVETTRVLTKEEKQARSKGKKGGWNRKDAAAFKHS
eukprot:INCI15888.1.p1 GENE.INCI15888.1~~INCI15888.1.p1  ORF type:complete len:610 (-),score=133.55 INCI15888.1:63-1892(-)